MRRYPPLIHENQREKENMRAQARGAAAGGVVLPMVSFFAWFIGASVGKNPVGQLSHQHCARRAHLHLSHAEQRSSALARPTLSLLLLSDDERGKEESDASETSKPPKQSIKSLATGEKKS